MKATKTHILLCDDDVNLTSVLAEFLRDRGYEVITARDGNDGLSKLGAGQCDICVVDSKMPKHDGFEFLENMRKTHVALPVIMVFEHGVQENILKAYERFIKTSDINKCLLVKPEHSSGKCGFVLYHYRDKINSDSSRRT